MSKTEAGFYEWHLNIQSELKNPFWDIEVWADFRLAGSDLSHKMHGFYSGQDSGGRHQYKLRWMPMQSGEWVVNFSTRPVYEDGLLEERITVRPEDLHPRGYLRAKGGMGWSLYFDNSEPFFLLGDTIYNLFGAAHSGVNVREVLEYRQRQGVNYIRSRVQVSPYHPEVGNTWQTKDCWPWGGSAQWPDFTRFNLDYFDSVDETLRLAEELGIGMEMIFEAWMLEFPFNDRNRFHAEHEEHWFRYIVSRYAAYPSIYIWCPANEYEFYPTGTVRYNPEADRWMERLAGYIRRYDPFRHPIGVHNWSHEQPISERVGHLADIDVYLVQSNWGLELQYDRDASLCMWLERDLRRHAPNRDKAVICSEFGYERVEGVYTAGAHQRFDHHHTRRGQWRAGISGYPIVHGFDNTWGAHMRVDIDAKGAEYLQYFRDFMLHHIRFDEMRPAADLVLEASGTEEEGTGPICSSNEDHSVIAVYFPVEGSCKLKLETDEYSAYWFNPRNGDRHPVHELASSIATPNTNEGCESWGDDWVLLLRREEGDASA